MASAQQISTKVGKNKRSVDNTKASDHMQAKITNNTKMEMTLFKSNSWSGSPEDAFPKFINPNTTVTFNHKFDGGFGSKAAVIYSGTNLASFPCAWVLGWYAPTTPSVDTPNQVYVTCGAQTAIEAIPWDQISMQIDAAPDSNSDDDPTTKITVTAKYDDKIPDTATIEATFGLM
ncbi:hypothetical protein RND81_12G093100 [Saponaria officinalis]|uniref:Uncharacterized protein n=1 Tax=Saponaria officinalis TaxID=3572 RepID=A0AAW1H8H8_SAPOF